MAIDVSPPKNTAGGGFVFEDHVCAWLFACILADEPPVDHDAGRIERIDFQTIADGWLLDDVLLTLVQGGSRSRCAISIKSNSQFGARTAPAEFVELAWKQFLQTGAPVFNSKSDLIGLFAAPLPSEVRRAVDTLVSKAKSEDSRLLSERIIVDGWASDLEKSIFTSFGCPPGLAGGNTSAANTGALLSRLRFRQFDFESTPSDSHNAAIRYCRLALRSGDPQEADKLWSELLRISADLRPKAGFVTPEILFDKLRGKFELSSRPDHRADWARIRQMSASAAGQVPNTICGSLQIDRTAELIGLQDTLKTARAVVLTGRSGIGKSVVARLLFEERQRAGTKTVWFDGRSFEREDLAAIEASLGLSHSVAEIARSVPDSDAVLILDGLDRLYDPCAFTLAAAFIKLFELGGATSPWRLVLTCQTQEWTRLQDALSRAGLPVDKVVNFKVEPLDVKKMELVWKTFPAVERLTRQKEMESLLSNLKILDLVVRRATAGEDIGTGRWVGESSVASWFWESEVGRGNEGAARSRLARLIAERQADTQRVSVPLDDFGVADLQSLGGLETERICRRTEDDHIVFTHDLYPDWARLRILISRADDLAEYFAERVDSPLWHRALRLYGLYLLEHLSDVGRWRTVLDGFRASKGGVAHDLLLEAAIFATDAQPLLELVSSDLLQSGGLLLRRLLTRFLAFATVPDPRMVALAEAEGFDLVSTRATYRAPNWPYWPAVLRFLHARRSDVVCVAPVEVSRIIEMWLKHTPSGFPLRREAGAVAVMLGERGFAAQGSYSGEDYDHRELYYRTALAAAPDLPEEIVALSMKLSARIATDTPSDTDDDEPVDIESVPWTVRMDPRFDPDEPAPTPWPDGPLKRIDERFRSVVLDSSSLMPLAEARPAAAREVALAVLIKPRRRFERNDFFHRSEVAVENEHRWHPPLFVDGPFIGFLRKNFSEGLELIARFVDFATDRAIEYAAVEAGARGSMGAGRNDLEQLLADSRRLPNSIYVNVNGVAREFIGGQLVFGWSAGLGNPPAAITAALMALEKHLYDLIDADKPIDTHVLAILARARSAAFLKVLCDIGKRDIGLFHGHLREILAVPEVYQWDIQDTAQGRTHLMFGALMRGRWFVRIAKEFNELAHRALDLRSLAVQAMFLFPDTAEFFAQARIVWRQRIDANPTAPINGLLEQLIIHFDPTNYRRADSEDGGVLVNVRALEVAHEREEERKELEDRLRLTTLPITCRKIIDENRELSSQELEALWEQIRSIHSSAPKEDRGDFGSGPEAFANAVSGGIAVLVRHRTWIADHRECATWCRSVITSILLQPPASSGFDTAESVASWTWDCFAAETFSTLWIADPNDVDLRVAVARLVLSIHYVAVEILFRRCAEARKALRDDFNRLRRFALALLCRVRCLLKADHFDRLAILSTRNLRRRSRRDRMRSCRN